MPASTFSKCALIKLPGPGEIRWPKLRLIISNIFLQPQKPPTLWKSRLTAWKRLDDSAVIQSVSAALFEGQVEKH